MGIDNGVQDNVFLTMVNSTLSQFRLQRKGHHYTACGSSLQYLEIHVFQLIAKPSYITCIPASHLDNIVNDDAMLSKSPQDTGLHRLTTLEMQ